MKFSLVFLTTLLAASTSATRVQFSNGIDAAQDDVPRNGNRFLVANSILRAVPRPDQFSIVTGGGSCQLYSNAAATKKIGRRFSAARPLNLARGRNVKAIKCN